MHVVLEDIALASRSVEQISELTALRLQEEAKQVCAGKPIPRPTIPVQL